MTGPAESLVFCDVRAIDPARNLDQKVDVVIEHGSITRIGPGAAADLSGERLRRVEAKEWWLMPGLVELCAHLGEPGKEYKEDIQSGLAAAAAGGYVRVCVMPDTTPVADTRAVTDFMLSRAKEVSAVRLHPVAAATARLKGKALTAMGELSKAGVVAVSDADHCVADAQLFRRILEYASNFDLPVMHQPLDASLDGASHMHEGNLSLQLGLRGSPRAAEESVLWRDLLLARTTHARYHANQLSSAGSVAALRTAKEWGAHVSAGVSPYHLLFEDHELSSYDPNFKLTPPLREPDDRQALLQGLSDGTIDVVATNHQPQTALEKDCEFADALTGAIGLETCLSLMLELVEADEINLKTLVSVLSTNPARVVGLGAPTLSEGAKADCILLDPNRSWSGKERGFFSRSRNSPVLQRSLRGQVLMTLASGKVAYDGLAEENREPKEASRRSE